MKRPFLSFLILLLMIMPLAMISQTPYPLQVTVVPKPTFFPPQVGDYLADPYRFFDVIIRNTTTRAYNIYLVMKLEMVTPLILPAQLQPKGLQELR